MTNKKSTGTKTTKSSAVVPEAKYEIVIVGGGAAGIATAASLLSRNSKLQIAIIEPADVHYYQPGWTMVGGGVFKDTDTARDMSSLIPSGVERIKDKVAAFEPDKNIVMLEDGKAIQYDRLVVCPGLKLDWDGVEGLTDALGRNGVTSNYRYDLAPYTWEIAQSFTEGPAIFTQPPMPIKCAGAPQKALYLTSDEWKRRGVIKDIDIKFMNAGGALFSVKEYVPALMKYIEKYGVDLNFFHNLKSIDATAKKATFEVKKPDTEPTTLEVEFGMMHVCPPQTAPDFIKQSPLADATGWVDVDKHNMRHATYDNIWALGDVTNTPNAKTAAAVRKQAPVVAANIVADIDGKANPVMYDGYGSCPLTVERGKIVLAEFTYGPTMNPTFPKFLLDGTKPTKWAWLLKANLLPSVYWDMMLKGKEILASPQASD